jgi:hypothetical protein
VKRYSKLGEVGVETRPLKQQERADEGHPERRTLWSSVSPSKQNFQVTRRLACLINFPTYSTWGPCRRRGLGIFTI